MTLPRSHRCSPVLGLAVLGLAVLASSGCRIGNPQPVVATEWRLVLDEQFEGAAGQRPDPQRWTYDVGGGGWGNQQLEFDTDRPENVSLDGQGHLVITARKEPFQGQAYTSARILTKGRFTQQFGRVEARIKLPTGQGIWPAFWMLGADFDTVGWPACGEIDIMEYRGQEPEVVLGSLHGPGYSGGAAITQRYTMPGGGRFDQDFHLFSIEWDSERISFFVDGQAYQTVTRGQVPGRWVFDKPFFILLNLAVGGTFVGAPNAATVFPQSMVVDYVRVYEAR